MKKISTFFLLAASLLGTPATVTAQTVFAPPGAEWWYEWRGMLIYPSFTHFRVVGDSLVGGQLARKVLVEEVTDTGANFSVDSRSYLFVRTTGDDVLSWDPATGAYRLEYRFNRPVGSSWSLLGCTTGGATTYVVDSAVSRTVNGTVLRTQYSSIPGIIGRHQIAQERIGSAGGLNGPLLFLRTYCAPGAPEARAGLVSYTDADVQIGTAPVLSRAEPLATMALSVAPNPSVSGRFRLEGITAKLVSYTVFDGQGRRVRAGQLTAAAPEINLAAEPAGLYLLRGVMSGRSFTRRLVR